MTTKSMIGALALALVLLGPLGAAADVTYSLTVPDSSGYATHTDTTPSPYGTVKVHWIDATHATITFQTAATTYVPANGQTYSDYYSFISNSMAGVNLSGGDSDGTNISFSNLAAYDEDGNAVSIADISRAYTSNSSNPDYVVAVDGFGKMNLVFDGPNFAGGNAPDIDKLVFDVAITDATWADAESVLTDDSTGYLAGAHLVADISGSPGWPDGGSALTGYAGNGPGFIPAPLPPSVLLLGSGLLGIVTLRKRSR
jgi:hypothetical protein